MSTTHTLSPTDSAVMPTSDGGARLTFPRVVRSEWIKFRTLRSTIWALAVMVVLMVGIAMLFALAMKSAVDSGQNLAETGVTGPVVVTGGYYFGQLTLIVLGALVITGEYSTGMIRSTFAAVPKRLPALWGKALVLAVTAFVVSAISLGLSWIATRAMLTPLHLTADFSDGETTRIIVGAALYLTLMSLLALACGALLRSSAAALAVVLGLVLVVENVFQIISLDWVRNIGAFLPSTAGARIMMPQSQIASLAQGSTAPQLAPWEGLGVLGLWVVVLLALAAFLIKRRDA